MIEYKPKIYDNPKVINLVSAWGKIPTILKDIIINFNLKTESALEFGVERGYSTTAIAYYFKHVIGVDPFHRREGFTFIDVKELLKDYKNIELFEAKFEDFILNENRKFDLIHIDIIHEYNPTFNCGEWALQHSNCVIFHDTMSFTAVMRAVVDLSVKYNFEFYNYPCDNGLGILIKK
jgi:predicted O-methyltransferase YrrM